MGFFRRGDDEQGSPDEGQPRIEDGGIPPAAQRRLKALSVDGGPFTSGLSTKEFAVLRGMGPRPLAQVMGASVVRVGWQYLPALPPGEVQTRSSGYSRGAAYSPMNTQVWANAITEPSPAQIRSYVWHSEVVCELETRGEAWNLARRRALDRLVQEAHQVGADAVVGVHLTRTDHDLGAGLIEYVVTGTAIRSAGAVARPDPAAPDDATPADPHPPAPPALGALSVQDFWRLDQAGLEPAGLLAASAVYFAAPARLTRLARTRSTQRNQELTELSQAFQAARDTVRGKLRDQLAAAGATHAVGVQFEHAVASEKLALASSLQTAEHRGWNRGRLGVPYWVSGHSDTDRRGWVITMHAAGTAVRARGAGPGDPVAQRPSIKTSIWMGAT